jgi:hypothetical protein
MNYLKTRYKETKNERAIKIISLPVVIFISVLQKNEREERVGLPSKHRYTHCSEIMIESLIMSKPRI